MQGLGSFVPPARTAPKQRRSIPISRTSKLVGLDGSGVTFEKALDTIRAAGGLPPAATRQDIIRACVAYVYREAVDKPAAAAREAAAKEAMEIVAAAGKAVARK